MARHQIDKDSPEAADGPSVATGPRDTYALAALAIVAGMNGVLATTRGLSVALFGTPGPRWDGMLGYLVIFLGFVMLIIKARPTPAQAESHTSRPHRWR